MGDPVLFKRTLRFKDKIEPLFFVTAMALEEISFKALQDEFGVPLSSSFESPDSTEENPKTMTYADAQKQGYRILAFKEGLTQGEELAAKQAVRTLFYPSFAEEEIPLYKTTTEPRLRFFFIPPDQHNTLCMDYISYEFDKALIDIAKVFNVKAYGSQLYLHKKPWVAPLSQKWLMAYGGFRIIDFDLQSGAGLLPRGDILVTNSRDEHLAKIIRAIGYRMSLPGRIKALAKIGQKERE